jgi:hypothetical protein
MYVFNRLFFSERSRTESRDPDMRPLQQDTAADSQVGNREQGSRYEAIAAGLIC